MKRNFSQIITSFNGKPVYPGLTPERVAKALDTLDPDVREKVDKAFQAAGIEPLTFAEACASSLCAAVEKATLKTKNERFKLAERLFAEGEIDITADDRDHIKAAVDKAYDGAVVPARVSAMLEGE